MIRVIVPVLGRPHQIGPLLDNLTEVSELEYRVVFVCSPDDDARHECEASGADTIVTTWEPDRADFAKKVNLAFRKTREEWLFQAATDLRFHVGWDTAAMKVARQRRVGVVGTNDLGNATVKRMVHSTHTFFSRVYIKRFGGTDDGSGSVFSEVYDHQYVDNEFVQLATLRGQWAFCRESIVEHLHPLWHKAELDATYEKAMRETQEDYRLYRDRVRELRRLYKGRR